MKRTLFLALVKQINPELDFLIPNTELKFAVSFDAWWLKLGLWERFILEKAEVEAHGFKQIGVELQSSLLHPNDDLRCNLSSNLLSYAE